LNQLQQYIHQSKYARWDEEKGRRETWEETISRYMNTWEKIIPLKIWNDLGLAIHRMEVMPSMRAMMTAGKALENNNIAGYNCAYMHVDSPYAFDEALYILMHGTGLGFSVERQFITNLPSIPHSFEKVETTIIVEDSKEGWQSAFRQLISGLYSGVIYKWDVSKVRKAGERLKTFGGRASGSGALVDLFTFTVEMFTSSKGRKLTSYNCHSLMCKIAEIVVVGGVRRSALMSLSNLSDQRMRDAKSGSWWIENSHFALANNSVAYTEKPEVLLFMDEWRSLVASRSGERGIFNRQAIVNLLPERRKERGYLDYGTNPCSEIALESNEFCNLTEVIARSTDTIETLKEKVRLATILGCLQSTLTNFKNLRPEWKQKCEEERLLGVSITGVFDCPILYELTTLNTVLDSLKQVAIDTAREWSERLGITMPMAITCIKPSGTVSLLCDTASGLHARHNPYYIRTVRGDNKDPLTKLMKASGVVNEPCLSKPDSTTIFSFAMKSPEGAICRNDLTALHQLEIWKTYQLHWCEHKPSVTVSVAEDEWVEVGAWVWKNFDILSGISFLPRSEHSYQQAPLQDCSKEEYDTFLNAQINWEQLSDFELEDSTTSAREYACVSGACELI